MKKITAILLTLVMLFVVAGCSKGTADNSSTGDTVSEVIEADVSQEEDSEASALDSSDVDDTEDEDEAVTSNKNTSSKNKTSGTSSKSSTTSKKSTTSTASKSSTTSNKSTTSTASKSSTTSNKTTSSAANNSSAGTSSKSATTSKAVSQISSNAETSSSQPAVTDVKELVDFIVDVEEGKDPVVLQLTDPQIIDSTQERTPDRISDIYTPSRMEPRCFKYIRETVEKTNPDLIIITGDIIYGEFDDSGTSLKAFIEFMEGLGVPWAPVFGNHDNESMKGVDWQCRQLEKAENCLFKQRELTGNGNYTVGITQGGKLKRVFFMLDSNGCTSASSKSISNGHTKTSVGFGNDQIAWYTETAKQIKELSSTTKLSFAFHVQLAVFADAFAKYGFDNETTEENPINIDKLSNKAAGDFGYLGRNLKWKWDTDYSVWNGLVALGVDSIFVGHEHCNSASVVYQGVRLQYGQKSSTYDRANYYNKTTGAIEGLGNGVGNSNYTPIIGGTVIPLSGKNGSITNPYIYLCADAGGNLDLTK